MDAASLPEIDTNEARLRGNFNTTWWHDEDINRWIGIKNDDHLALSIFPIHRLSYNLLVTYNNLED